MRVLIAAPLILAACAPLSPEAAYRACSARAQAAAAPQGAAEIGVGTGGVSTGLSLSVTSDYLRGRDPGAVYDACIRARTGQGPTQPLVLR
ncbi:hypothetical protein [Palleronia sp.]|uniref:hypothetical protein n=1 Tax=Palleronia sp. TaxID=1940284 RepID=UPI0035C7FDEB